MASYEGSAEDRANDRKQAKARGISAKVWEGSPEDALMDARGQAKLDMGSKIPDHHFAHRRPKVG